MELLNFLNKNKNNWEEILSSSPYNLKIKKDNNYILFSYDMFASDMSLQIVREARGSIFYFNGENFECVCHPFDKFFNVDEPNNDIEIDWDSALVQEKVDGSLIKLWYHNNRWHLSTNGTIDAFKAIAYDNVSFGDLVVKLLPLNNEKLYNRDICYMFELVSPYTQIVINYPDVAIYYLGARNMKTDKEYNYEFYNSWFAESEIKQPKLFPLSSLSDCRKATAAMGSDEEGFVVCDKNFNRVKIKSPAYVTAHRLVSNININTKNIIEMMREGVLDDVLSIKPNIQDYVNYVLNKYKILINKMESSWYIYSPEKDRKNFAKKVKDIPYKAYLFKRFENNNLSAKDYLNSLSINSLMKILDAAT